MEIKLVWKARPYKETGISFVLYCGGTWCGLIDISGSGETLKAGCEVLCLSHNRSETDNYDEETYCGNDYDGTPYPPFTEQFKHIRYRVEKNAIDFFEGCFPEAVVTIDGRELNNTTFKIQ